MSWSSRFGWAPKRIPATRTGNNNEVKLRQVEPGLVEPKLVEPRLVEPRQAEQSAEQLPWRVSAEQVQRSAKQTMQAAAIKWAGSGGHTTGLTRTPNDMRRQDVLVP